MSHEAEQIKDRLSIEEVIGDYITLERAGQNLKAKCPFHNEKTPSFLVSPDRGSYYCFGCGAKGDIFSFVQEFESTDFLSALKMLAERAGVTLTGGHKRDTEKDRLYELLDFATIFYYEELKKNKEAMKYVVKRGLPDDIVEKWRIGYAPQAWETIRAEAKAKKYTDDELEKVGLIKKSEKKPGEYYDRFRDRIMFPIFDKAGKAVGFSGRILHDDGKAAKYLNSPETVLFDKSNILHGYNFAKTSIRKLDFSILVEGQVDLLMSHGAGYTNTVASSGTAITVEQLQMLRRISDKLVIAYDADGAGFKASERAWKIALSLGMDVKIARMPQGEDPADIISRDKNVWKEIIRDARHIITFLLEVILENESGRNAVRSIEAQVLPYIAMIKSPIEQEHFLNEIHRKTDISLGTLQKALAKASGDILEDVDEEVQQRAENTNSKRKTLRPAERLGCIVKWQQLADKPLIDMSKVEEQLKRILGEDRYAKNFLPYVEKIDEQMIFEIESYYNDSSMLQNDVDDLLKRVEGSILDGQRKEIQKKLASGTENDETELLKAYQELSKKMNDLR